MKQIILLANILFCCVSLNAQETYYNRPFIEEGKVWKVGSFLVGTEKPQSVKEFFFDGDSTIAGISCKRWMCNEEGRTDYIGGLFEEDRRVYLFLPHSTQAGLLYDFGAKTGECVEVMDAFDNPLGRNDINCFVTHVFSVKMKDRILRCTRINEGYQSDVNYTWNVWMEGIGTKCSPLINLCDSQGTTDRLIECSINGEVIYDAENDPVNAVHDIITDYHPFIEEGKQWLTGRFIMADPSTPPFSLSTFFFEGDTIVSGKLCKRWVKKTQKGYNQTDVHETTEFVLPLYEENRQVWFFPEGQEKPRLLYDFSPTEDTITVYRPSGDGFLFIHRAISETENENPLRLYDFRPLEEDDFHEWFSDEVNHWIEGIGTGIAPDYIYRMDVIGNVETLLECRVNDHILYLNNEWATKTKVKSGLLFNSSPNLFDLSGRRLTTPPAKGVYIEDGKKRVRN